MKIAVCTTIASWKCTGTEEMAWVRQAEFMQDACEDAGHTIKFFAALEQDDRDDAPFKAIIHRLEQLDDATVWRYRYDDGADEINSDNRLHRICTGRNMAQEFAVRDPEVTHILFMDSDIMPDPDLILRLLELDHPVVGATVVWSGSGQVVYSHLDGQKLEPGEQFGVGDLGASGFVPETSTGWVPEGADVRVHWNSAGCLLVERDVFRCVQWHRDPDAGLSDDPAYQRETARQFGPTWVRHDVTVQHVPMAMVPVEQRTNYDKKVYRDEQE